MKGRKAGASEVCIVEHVRLPFPDKQSVLHVGVLGPAPGGAERLMGCVSDSFNLKYAVCQAAVPWASVSKPS